MTDPERRNQTSEPLAGPRAPAIVAFLGRYARALAMLVLTASAIFHPARMLVADHMTPLPRDLTPGRMFEAPAYVAPPGCPVRAWAAGDYLPLACQEGDTIADTDAPTYGLETPRHIGSIRRPHQHRGGWRGYRQRHWARAGADALLLTGPSLTSSLVVGVIPGRFASTAPKPAGGDPAGTNYRAQPEDYRIAVRRDLWFAPLVQMAGAGLLGLSMLYDAIFKRRRR